MAQPPKRAGLLRPMPQFPGVRTCLVRSSNQKGSHCLRDANLWCVLTISALAQRAEQITYTFLKKGAELLAGAGKCHTQRAAIQWLVMELLDCLLGCRFGAHFNEAEAARTAGVTLQDDLCRGDMSAALEVIAQRVVGDGIAKIGDVEIGLHIALSM